MNDRLPTHEIPIAELKAQIRLAQRRVTSYDVALAAGVSQSAVSRCFQHGASVSKATHARVMKAARDLDYTPNAAARSLITRRSNLVAVLISSEVTLHYPEVLSELAREFGRHGIRILLFSLALGSDIDHTLTEIWKHQVDGAVVAAPLGAAQRAEFERRQVPFVLFNRGPREADVNSIACDQREAARVLVSRLAAAGHKRFAMIDGPLDSSIAIERRRAVTERLAEIGLKAPLVVSGSFDYASGGHGMREIAQRSDGLPDAVICGNDVMAIGCLDTARIEMKLEVPRQLSIAGFDGIAPSAWLSYKLTTLRQPMTSMSIAAADMLVGLIRDAARPPEHRVFSASVVEGDTARLGPSS